MMPRDSQIAPMRKKGMTVLEFVFVLMLIGIAAALILPSIGGSGSAAPRANCANNLKLMGLILKMYAGESKGEIFPSMLLKDCNGQPLAWSKTMDMALVYPEYLSDANVLVCPSNPHVDWGEKADAVWYSEDPVNPDFPLDNPYAMNDVIDSCELLENSYTYYSHLFILRESTELITQDSLEFFRKDFSKLITLSGSGEQSFLKEDIKLNSSTKFYTYSQYAPATIPQIRIGLERWFGRGNGTTDCYKYMVVMHDRIPKDLKLFHEGNGVNVLFIDGHVEYVKNDEEGEFVFGAVGEIVQRRW